MLVYEIVFLLAGNVLIDHLAILKRAFKFDKKSIKDACLIVNFRIIDYLALLKGVIKIDKRFKLSSYRS